MCSCEDLTHQCGPAQVSLLIVSFLPADPCSLPLDEGNCSRFTLRWYYNQRVAECRPFIYSGCGGNLNRFYAKEDCDHQCTHHVDTGKKARQGSHGLFLL
uniref:BPTI/Kunitz inhibitor domain-containing protein n=1 Tax=Crocodylus porosus TaxID=8502 RepID=A0A7M4FJQ7_CROPO